MSEDCHDSPKERCPACGSETKRVRFRPFGAEYTAPLCVNTWHWSSVSSPESWPVTPRAAMTRNPNVLELNQYDYRFFRFCKIDPVR
jgi:hypothetical protein